MYEDKFFEVILNDMMNRVKDSNPDLDTRTGSMIYTALAPMALELESAYREMDMILEETFLSTASKEYLLEHGKQIGVAINTASECHVKGEFDVDIPINSRFTLNTFNYRAITKLSDPTVDNPYYIYELECETSGTAPNGFLGDLVPITYVPNLTHATLISTIKYGEDEEDTESYRYRIQSHLQKSPINGNVYQYNSWLDDYSGIGKHRVIPCWNGVNTVKLTILNSENRKADDTLIAEVQEYFDPLESPGMGMGQAPIGAIVTVDTVDEVGVYIECALKLKNGYTSAVGVKEGIEEYLNSILLNKTTIGYMPISAAIYNAESVDDVQSLTITVNGVVMDTEVTPFIDSVDIGINEIAVLSESSIFEVSNNDG